MGLPARSPRATPRSAPKRSVRGLDAARGPITGLHELDQHFDWYSFVCLGCGEETFVGRDPEQSVVDFGMMMDWLYGERPVCTSCLMEQ